jgi:hypothetical protein
MYWSNHTSAGSWIFSIFGTVIILVLIVVAIIWLVSDRRGGREAHRWTGVRGPSAAFTAAWSTLEPSIVLMVRRDALR